MIVLDYNFLLFSCISCMREEIGVEITGIKNLIIEVKITNGIAIF